MSLIMRDGQKLLSGFIRIKSCQTSRMVRKRRKERTGDLMGVAFISVSASVERLILYSCALIRIKFIEVWF